MGKIYSVLLVAILIFWVPVCSRAQESSGQEAQPAAAASATGPTAFAVAVGKHSNLGGVYSAGVGIGYNITEHLGGDVGASLYTIQSPFSVVSNKDWRWTTLAGDPFVDLRYTTKFHGLDATSVLTGAIPISSAERVYTTGRFGVDWYNHISASFAGFTPFVNIGAANETIDRWIFPRPYNIARPYQIFGPNGNGEAGASYTIFKHYTVGASAYAVVPVGTQKVFSRLVTPNSSVSGDANHNRVWNQSFETIGDSKLGRDNGYSGWVEVARVKNLNVEAGYTYSVHYRWGSAYLMLKFDGTSLIRFLTATD
ncbi:MAG: hypothetical protein EPN47_11225 [Acidobacteria bacterium]|nr:MAG: hypothetical protein EPN47_11225 [Acidobacteriota bacterium]